MAKINTHIGIKVPINGVQFSNIEISVDWEEETDRPIQEALIALEPAIRGWVDDRATQVSASLKSTLELQAEKLAKGREAYLLLLEEKKKLVDEINLLKNRNE